MNVDLRHAIRSACLLLPFLLVSGCASMDTDFSPWDGLVGSSPEAEPAVSGDEPTATVVMVANGQSPVSAPLPLRSPTYVQQALEITGLDNRFGRMTIELYRPLPSGNHRMEIVYDRPGRQVVPAYDYELRPGDQLVVTEDTSTIFDDMLESLSFPFK